MPFTLRPPHAAPDMDTIECCVAHGESLDTWVRCSWDAGVQIETVDDLDILRVHTRNSSYELAVVSGQHGQMLVRGGRYFREWTRVHFLGCSLGGALLKRHTVHVGLRMEFHLAGRRIVTSPVHAIGRDAVSRPAVAC